MRNSNNVVAMNNLLLKTQAGRAKQCGKRVIATLSGVTSDTPFFIGDGCERCAHGSDSVWYPNAAAGLDFSYTALDALSPLTCHSGHIDISLDIDKDENVRRAAVKVLGGRAVLPNGVVMAVAARLNDRDANVRTVAVEELGRCA